jgi:hypothetical protein
MKMIHSIENIGGTTLFPGHLVVALDGFKRTKATPVLINTTSILAEIEINALTFTRIGVISDKESLTNLEAPTNNPQKFKSLPFIMLPPFLWETIINIEDKSPANVFMESSKTIKNFIDKHKENEQLNKVTKITCSNLLTFLWAATNNIMTSITFLPSGDDTKIQKWCHNRHLLCIKQETTPTPTTNIQEDELQCISEAIELSQTSLSESISAQSSAEKKGFSKLDESVKNLILNASAPNCKIAAGEPSVQCKTFFKQSSHGNARLNFIRTLKHKFNAPTEVSSGVITSLYNGCFNWEHKDSPSNFSMFSFPEKKILSRNAMSDCIVLQLKEIGGKGLSNEDVKEALKQEVEIPRTIDSMKYSIFNILAATKFFFSEHSLLMKALIVVHNHVVKNRSIYISIHHQNKLFIGQFLFALDTRINLWLESCEECKFRDEVDDNLINFSEILQEVRIRNFSYILPMSIR